MINIASLLARIYKIDDPEIRDILRQIIEELERLRLNS